MTKPDRSRANKSGQIHLLTTEKSRAARKCRLCRGWRFVLALHPPKRIAHGSFEGRDVILINLPDHCEIEIVVGMAQPVTYTSDIPPRQSWTQLFCMMSKPFGRPSKGNHRLALHVSSNALF
jgi:hypothetical protein